MHCTIKNIQQAISITQMLLTNASRLYNIHNTSLSHSPPHMPCTCTYPGPATCHLTYNLFTWVPVYTYMYTKNYSTCWDGQQFVKYAWDMTGCFGKHHSSPMFVHGRTSIHAIHTCMYVATTRLNDSANDAYTDRLRDWLVDQGSPTLYVEPM